MMLNLLLAPARASFTVSRPTKKARPAQPDAGIWVGKMLPERPTPAEETGFASGLQAALVHNGLYLFLPPSGSDLVRGPRPIPFYLPYGKLNITAYITNAKFSNSC